MSFLPIVSPVSIGGLFLTAVMYQVQGTKEKTEIHGKLMYLVLTGVFVVHLASGLNTEHSHRVEFFADVVQQLPFLLMPLSFALLPTWPVRYLHRLFLLFYCLVVISALGSTSYYLLHITEINKLYSQSQIMPTVPDYIRFSLMVTFAIAIGVIFIRNNIVSTRIRWGLITGTLFLVIYLYILAVRSGLGAFNMLCLLAIGWLIIKRHNYKYGVLLGVVVILLPTLSFVCFPTFRNKYYNTQYDVAQASTVSSANNLSLVGRYYSYKVGFQLARQNPWFGVGKADMQQEVGNFYKRDYPEIEASSYLMPHNQLLYYLIAFGSIGLFAFLFCFYYPLFAMWKQASLLLISHYIIVSLSFVAEFTLDQANQVGLIYSLFFIVLSIASMNSERSENLVKYV